MCSFAACDDGDFAQRVTNAPPTRPQRILSQARIQSRPGLVVSKDFLATLTIPSGTIAICKQINKKHTNCTQKNTH